MKMFYLFAVLFLLAGCSSFSTYLLPALPFDVTLPVDYGFVESETSYFFSSQGGPAVFYFEKTPEPRAFFELFENGYEEWTPKSSGVWVICEKGDWENCYVQNLAFLELYPLHVRTGEQDELSEEALEEIRAVLMHIRAD